MTTHVAPAAVNPHPGAPAPSVLERLDTLDARLAELRDAERSRRNSLTIIVFSGEVDRQTAAFVLATGAAAMGVEVSMFFTFWGLAGLKRHAVYRGKGLLERLLTLILPSGPAAMGSSRWNCCGLGPAMLSALMRRHKIAELPELVATASELGVRFIGCQTSMELMGIRREELGESIEFGGAAACLERTMASGATLFV